MNLADNLTRTAAERPDAPALVLGDEVTTYADLEEASRKVAGLLRRDGVREGDRVALMLPNVPQFAALYYGVLRLGAVVVPVNPVLKEQELAYHLQDCGARVVYAWGGARKAVEPAAGSVGADAVLVDPASFEELLAAVEGGVDDVAPCEDDDTAVILYTSGTTGRPKGAELTHANLVRNVDVVVEDLADLSGEDVIFGGLPLFHVFGQTAGLNASVRAGASLTLLPRFDPGEALEIVQRRRVTVMEGVPTMYVAMLNHRNRDEYDVSSLRMCVSGGAAMPVEVMTGFENAFGTVVLEGYGLSETSPVAAFNRVDRRRPGSIGIPVPGVSFRLVDPSGADVAPGEPGEILIRGHNVMKGYWQRPEETAQAIEDGWFHTGDVGRQDEDGFYYVVDRKKEMVIRGGYNVYPREIEEVLYQHPAVAEAAVVGVPHPALGEEVAAVVTVREGQAVTPAELQRFLRARVASYKYPRIVEIVDALPKNATGKIVKRLIQVQART